MRRVRWKRERRKGAILVLAAILMIVLCGMVAFVVDIGYISLSKAQLQRTADAVAHSIVLDIADPDLAKTRGLELLALTDSGGDAAMKVAGENLVMLDQDIEFGRRSFVNGVYQYDWNPAGAPNCVKVTARRAAGQGRQGPVSLFFGAVLGKSSQEVFAESIAAVNPRDIVFVVDLSGSMNHDSEPWSVDALDWLSGDATGPGDAGTTVMNDLWDDLGLTGLVNYSDLNQTQNRFDFTSRDNTPIELPDLTGITQADALALYKAATGAGDDIYIEGGVIKAKLGYSEINGMLGETDVTSRFPSGWSDYAHTEAGAYYMHNYDFVIDKYLANSMQYAKPPISNEAYRDYWRGYVGYTRGYSSGMGSSSGIKGWANPSSDYWANKFSNQLERDGQNYPAADLKADFNDMVNKASYKSYIQFMMDHGFNSKPGRNIYGNSSPCCYTPMSMRWEDDNPGSDDDAYRRTDAQGRTRPPREQPAAGVVDAVIVALEEIKEQNSGIGGSDDLKDKVAVLVFHSSFTPITLGLFGASDPADPFTTDYDGAIEAVIKTCSQALPNGWSNVDGTAGSTNTQYGMENAGDWVEDNGRAYTEKVTILFTDGVANTITNAYPLDDFATAKIDADNDGQVDDNYYFSNDASDAKNAALKAASRLKGEKSLVHTVMAGAGRDKDLPGSGYVGMGTRMALFTDARSEDGGATYSDYSGKLLEIFEDLARKRAVSFGYEGY